MKALKKEKEKAPMKMKTFLLFSLVLLLAFFSTGFVASLEDGRDILVTERLSLSANASDVALSGKLAGGYLYHVELFASADDIVTFTIKSHLGTTLFTHTTTAATGGEIKMPTAFWGLVADKNATYTLSGLGSGTLIAEVTVIKK